MNKLKVFATMFIVCCSAFLFSGCWDVIELNEIFIATAMAIDVGEDPDEIEVTLEVPKIGNTTGMLTSSSGESENGSTILFKANSNSITKIFEKINTDSSRSITLQQMQVVLISKEVAEKGITNFLDFFLRARQPRIEMQIVVVDGKASDILKITPQQEKTASGYLLGLLSEITRGSKVYKLRVLDFINDILEKSSTSVAPVVSKQTVDDTKRIMLSGVGYFEKGKLIEIKNNEEINGLLFATGSLQEHVILLESEEGKVAYRIKELKTNEKIEMENNNIKVSYQLYPIISVVEVNGFEKFTFLEFLEKLKLLVNTQIESFIKDEINYLQQIDVDALKYETKIYKKSPKKWNEIKDDWYNIFQNLQIKVECTTSVPEAGKSAESLDMELFRKNDR